MPATRRTPRKPPREGAPPRTDPRPPRDHAPRGDAGPQPARGADAPREKAFLLARPEQRLLEAIARRLPAPSGPTTSPRSRSRPPSRSRSRRRPGTCGRRRRCSSCTGSATRSTGRSRACGAPSGRATATTSTTSPTPSPPRSSGSGSGSPRTCTWPPGLVLVIAYLALSINSYLETQALGRFTLGYGRLGPTEARIGLIALLAAVALGAQVVVARPHAARPRRR